MTIALVIAAGALAGLAFELRRRSALLADAAHELRGPLTALSLGLEALRRQPVARRVADALMTELSRMEAAAEDVVAAGRGRRARTRPLGVPLGELVERSADAWRPAAERGGGRLLVDWCDGAANVQADRRRLAQAFGNLLANAVEHGGGEIVVRGRPSRNGVQVEVIDRGSSASEPAAGPARGRGRGLRIAARAVREAGGTIESRPRPEGGRAVSAELPVERAR